MNQRQLEKAIFQFVAAYLDGMDYQEFTEAVGFTPVTPTQEQRLTNARHFVTHQIWKRSQ